MPQGQVCNYYGREITQILSGDRIKQFVYKPDVIVKGLGEYCGDQLALRLKARDGKLEVEYELQACVLTQASLLLMLDKICGLPIPQIRSVLAMMNESFHDPHGLCPVEEMRVFDPFHGVRRSCIELPWKVMGAGLLLLESRNEVWKGYGLGKRHSLLGCDACVVGTVCSPCPEPSVHKPGENTPQWKFPRLVAEILELDPEFSALRKVERRIKTICGLPPARLGKCSLNEQELSALKKLTDRWEDDFLGLLKKMRISPAVGYHLETNFPGIVPPVYQEYIDTRKTLLAERNFLWELIRERLQEKGVPFSVIKGHATQNKYHALGMHRDYNDIDILTPTFGSFLQIIRVLLFEFGFELFDLIGVAGSLKEFTGSQLSGHAHLMRVSDENEHIIIDINFPSLPLSNRLLKLDLPYLAGPSDPTNLLLLSLAHAFKHTRAPVNDVNDCYVLLKENQIKWDELLEKIRENKLGVNAEGVRRALIRWFSMDRRELEMLERNTALDLWDRLFVPLFILLGWPYSRIAHKLFVVYVRSRERALQPADSGGKDPQGFLGTAREVREVADPLDGSAFRRLVKDRKGKRIYLLPLISFRQPVDIEECLQACDRHSLPAERVLHNALLIRLQEETFLLTDCILFTFSDGLEIPSGSMSAWMQSGNVLLGLLDLAFADHYYRFIFNPGDGVWQFE